MKRNAAFTSGDKSGLPLEITMISATVMAAKRPFNHLAQQNGKADRDRHSDDVEGKEVEVESG